jgi:hemolysin-activating ACP:hemolysin acyltransferase
METSRKLTKDFDSKERLMQAGALGAMSPGRGNAFAASFAQIVAVLMRDPTFKQLTLANLESLVLPPLIAGQFAIAHAQSQGGGAKKADVEGSMVVPVAVALWAKVSAGIDKVLSENPEKRPRLQPSGWVSGSTIWLMVLGGDRRAIPKLLDQLLKKDFSGQVVKMRVSTPDGKVSVKTLSAQDEQPGKTSPATTGNRPKHPERALTC